MLLNFSDPSGIGTFDVLSPLACFVCAFFMYFSCFTLCRKSYWISGSGIAPTHSSAMAHFVVAPMAIDVKHHHHPQHSGHHNLPATSISPSPTILSHTQVRAGKELLPRVASTGDGGPDEEAGAKRKIRRDEVRAGKEMLPRVASTGDGGPDEEAGAKRNPPRQITYVLSGISLGTIGLFAGVKDRMIRCDPWVLVFSVMVIV
ncbi:hypothetical protein M8J77_011129 [Diaphorina citri]|nr:hypothetical protein M8J77_011129 [Diaphorina citri]